MKTNLSSLPYRSCVGMMLLNRADQVFVAKRIDMVTEAWQMPQGGVDDGEDLRQAALRELEEEIGTNKVEILAESHEWLHYDLPEDLIPKVWGGKFRGQTQKWFLMRFTGDDSDINILTEHPEFSEWRWAKPEALPELIVPFKRPLYEDVLKEFLPYL